MDLSKIVRESERYISLSRLIARASRAEGGHDRFVSLDLRLRDIDTGEVLHESRSDRLSLRDLEIMRDSLLDTLRDMERDCERDLTDAVREAR